MLKELHVWMHIRYHVPNLLIDYETTNQSIKNGEEIINTTIPNFCDSKYYQMGYKIFVHMFDGESVEIKPGKVMNTDREIKLSHNWIKLLLANEFGKAVG